PEKMTIRRLNFVAILTALIAIADGSYKQERIADYQAIPENGRTQFDVLIRNATVVRGGKSLTLDIGINRQEINADSARAFRYRSIIEEVGDLSTFYGLEEIDATGLTLTPARTYPDMIDSLADLRRLDLAALRSEGITVFRVRRVKRESYPAQLVHLLYEGKLPGRTGLLGQIPTFLLKRGDQIEYNFVNGFWLHDPLSAENYGNGITE
ncbi:MAG TPA: hypothetical protein VK364_10785, partial [Hymenobacter sp.]|nr:hypothetical protein [Hymenobacter sp.]